MDDILLAKSKLPSDYIDASFGEPYIIRNNLAGLFLLKDYNAIPNFNVFEYQSPNGWEPLVKLLEDKYQAPVVITNGAKQALGAIFYAIKKNGGKKIGLKTPYWGLLKPLIEMHGCSQVEHIDDSDAYLLVSPNNPDGNICDEHTVKYYSDLCFSTKRPLIHDAAYYSHIYTPQNLELKPIGDVQIFTCSKLYGLSGLRIGYAVFYNTELYKYVMEYMEHMTVGVSSLSQLYAYNLLVDMKVFPERAKQFEENSYQQLQEHKQIVSQINPAILDTKNIVSSPGMFLWTKCHNLQAFTDAKIKIIEGTPFGAPNYIRMNLALPKDKIIEIVKRLNKE